jgi:Tol biopolymer transport system component
LVSLGSLLGFALVGVPAAQALTPPEAPRAEVVYSNGGRILSIKADGSDRRVLASRFDKTGNTELGFVEPAVSPDGSKIAFVNRRFEQSPGYVSDIWVMDDQGGSRVKVLSGDEETWYSSPSWSPDGETLIASWYRSVGQRQVAGIVSIRPDGSGREIIFRLKAPVKKSWWPSAAVGNPVMSPDGTKVLFVRVEEPGFSGDGRLEVLDLQTGKRTVISNYSFGGSWSPDGTRVVHSVRNTGDDEVCGIFYCETAGKLRISKADGSGSRSLVAGGGHEMVPDWSADGSRIVFASNRNMPESSDAWEVYSVARDGSCLTWLTNGNPASTDPDWSGGAGDSTYPGGCGAQGRGLLNEVDPPTGTARLPVKLWLGRSFGGTLYTGNTGPFPDEPYRTLIYSDCAFYDPGNCGEQVQAVEFPVCLARDLGGLVGSGLRRFRGVPSFVSRGDGSTQVVVISGDRFLVVFRGGEAGSNRQIFRGIRPFGSGPNPWKLPPPLFPASGVQLMKKVERVHRRTGSVIRTAKVVGIGRESVRRNLRLRPVLRRFGPIRTVKCPPRRQSGVSPDGGASGSISSSLPALLPG